MRADPHTARHYTGTYAADTLPRHAPQPGMLIMNNRRIKHPGEHWCAAWVDPNGRGTYFDSYGRPPVVKEHMAFMNRNCAQWTYNKTPLQAMGSNVCGQYCATFLIHVAHGVALEDYVHAYFTENVQKNDVIVNSLFRRYAAETTLCRELSLTCNAQTCWPRK